MRVRDASLADLPRLLELVHATETGARWSEAQLCQMLTNAGTRLILVIDVEGNVPLAGFAVAQLIRTSPDTKPGPGEIAAQCELENIVIAPRFQRQGLGRKLLETLLERLHEAGGDEVFLEVRESNAGARQLYLACGFVEVGRRVKYYSQPAEDAVLYRFSARGNASATVQT